MPRALLCLCWYWGLSWMGCVYILMGKYLRVRYMHVRTPGLSHDAVSAESAVSV